MQGFFKVVILSACVLAHSLAAKSETVYKTPSGLHYHLLECRMVNNVSIELSISDAMAEELTPSKICQPPSGDSAKEALGKHGVGISETVPCKGLTKVGTRCKHKTRMAMVIASNIIQIKPNSYRLNLSRPGERKRGREI